MMDHKTEMILKAPKGLVPLNLGELWAYRHMIYYLTVRNLTAAYKQSVIGPFWILVNAAVSVVVYSFIFGVVANIETGNIPYPIFNYSGLIPWTLFVGILGAVTSSVSRNAMYSKVYFPRLAIPLTEVANNMIAFFITFILLVGMMVYYGIYPTINIVFLPFFTFVAIATSLGLGLWFAPLDVQSRDIRQLVAYLGRFWLYMTPVLYPITLLPDEIAFLIELNPMTLVVQGFRWGLIGGDAPTTLSYVGAGIGTALLISGMYYFKYMEKIFVDIA